MQVSSMLDVIAVTASLNRVNSFRYRQSLKNIRNLKCVVSTRGLHDIDSEPLAGLHNTCIIILYVLREMAGVSLYGGI